MTTQLSASEIVLASASPRRAELLALAGVPFRVRVANVDERLQPGEDPEAYTLRAARDKAKAVAGDCQAQTWILGADTAVVLGNRILGKPNDSLEAEEMLRALSGREHSVLTGVCLYCAGTCQERVFSVRTQVVFRSLSEEVVRGYVMTGEPLDKAGAYGIQGQGAALVIRLVGSYTNVVGLPLSETIIQMEELGIFRPFAWAGEGGRP